MKILHISTECYPAAKAGGMGDVVGALPIYQQALGVKADVIIPKYGTKWFADKPFIPLFSGLLEMEGKYYDYTIQKLGGNVLPFDLYAVDIPQLYDRDSVYLAENGHGFPDEPERNIAFQRAACDFIAYADEKYDIVHCHDHQAGLIPFFLSHVEKYRRVKDTPTFFTIHNGQYRGVFHWDRVRLLPAFPPESGGLLEWGGAIHSQAAAIKCTWKVNTVSPAYMEELKYHDAQLQWLYQNESEKCVGILNGADYDLWNPSTDPMLPVHLNGSWATFKEGNKKHFCEEYGLDPEYPLFAFIGRLAHQKGADLLPGAIHEVLSKHREVAFAILGTGDKWLENSLARIAAEHPGNVASIIAYNETVAHRIYASSDFLMMPSRFEPCGLNQIFAMRYGSVPVVRETGGLIDTVPDISENGNGLVFKYAESSDIAQAIERGMELFSDKAGLYELVDKIKTLDFSWKNSARIYIDHYESMIDDFKKLTQKTS